MSPSNYTRKTISVDNVYSNVNQDIIQITEDKLKLVLNEHLTNTENRKSWIAPLGILITLVIVFVTTNFNDFIVSKNTWEAIFILSTIITTGWLIYSLYKIPKYKSVEDIIKKIKNEDN